MYGTENSVTNASKLGEQSKHNYSISACNHGLDFLSCKCTVFDGRASFSSVGFHLIFGSGICKAIFVGFTKTL